MAARHWHWSFRVDDYYSMFTYPDREAAQAAVDKVKPGATDFEIMELPCVCNEAIYIGPKLTLNDVMEQS